MNGQHKRQFNFVHPLELKTINFDDYNNDNSDEIILFTKQGDSLFVSIIDLSSLTQLGTLSN